MLTVAFRSHTVSKKFSSGSVRLANHLWNSVLDPSNLIISEVRTLRL